MKIRYNQLNDEVKNITEKKLPKLKTQISQCHDIDDNSDSEKLLNNELSDLCKNIDNFNQFSSQKAKNIDQIDSIGSDLAKCQAILEWCDEKKMVLNQLQIPDDLDQVELVK